MKVNIYCIADVNNPQFKSDPEVDFNFILIEGERYQKQYNLLSYDITQIQYKFPDLDKVIILKDSTCTYHDFAKDIPTKYLNLFEHYQYQKYNFIYVHGDDEFRSRHWYNLVLPNHTNILLTTTKVDPRINENVKSNTDAKIDIVIYRTSDQPFCWRLTEKCGITYCETHLGKDWAYLQIDRRVVT